MYRDFLPDRFNVRPIMKVNVAAAKRLRKLRIDNGYSSAKDFAEKNDFSVETYRSYENGARNITLRAAKKIASILNSDHNWILDGEKPEQLKKRMLTEADVAEIYSIKALMGLMLKYKVIPKHEFAETFSRAIEFFHAHRLPEAERIVTDLHMLAVDEPRSRGQEALHRLLEIAPLGSA